MRQLWKILCFCLLLVQAVPAVADTAPNTNPSTNQDAQLNAAIELGRDYIFSKDYAAAFWYFQTLVKRYPDHSQPYFWLVFSADRADVNAQATTLLNTSLEPDYQGPLNPSYARYGLALQAKNAGQPAHVVELLAPVTFSPQPNTNNSLSNSEAKVLVLRASSQFYLGDRLAARATLEHMLALAKRERERSTGVCFLRPNTSQSLQYLTKEELDARSPEEQNLALLARCQSAFVEAWRLWNALDALQTVERYGKAKYSVDQVTKPLALNDWYQAWFDIAEYAVVHGNRLSAAQFSKAFQQGSKEARRWLGKHAAPTSSSVLESLNALTQRLRARWVEAEKPTPEVLLLQRQEELLRALSAVNDWSGSRSLADVQHALRVAAKLDAQWPKDQNLPVLASFYSVIVHMQNRANASDASLVWLAKLVAPLRKLKKPIPLLRVLKTLTLESYKAKRKGLASDYLRALQYTLIDNKLVKRRRADFLVQFPTWLKWVPVVAFAMLMLVVSAVSAAYMRHIPLQGKGWRFRFRMWRQSLVVATRAMARVNRRWSVVFMLAALVYIAVLWLFYWLDAAIYADIYPYTGVWPNIYVWLTLLWLYLIVNYIRLRVQAGYRTAAEVDQQLGTKGIHEAWLVFGGENTPLLQAQIKQALRQAPSEKYWALDRDTSQAVGAFLLLILALLSLNRLPMPEVGRPIIMGFDECAPLEPPPKEADEAEKPLELQRIQRVRQGGGEGPRGRTGLDVNVQPVPDSMLDKLRQTLSVGGLDEKGEPMDFYTGFPDRPWQYPRQDLDPSATKQDAPGAEFEAIQHEPIQYIPARYKGRWQEYDPQPETKQEDSP